MVPSNQESEADSLERYYLDDHDEPTHDSKLVIKLKMPSDQEAGDTASSSSLVKKNNDNKEHYCYDCDKSFSSGKALGGHMSSAHVQAGKDYQSKKLRIKKFKHHRGSAADLHHVVDSGLGEKIACEICGKDFPTRKSLYGHMRCHPDRDYRGMQPPPPPHESKKAHTISDHVYEPPPPPLDHEAKEEDSSSLGGTRSSSSTLSRKNNNDGEEEVGVHPIDLTRFLTRWAVTGQRGRQGSNPDMASFSDQFPSSLPRAEVQLSDVARSLVSLSNGNHHRSTYSMTPDGEEIVDVNSVKVEEEKTQVFCAAKDFEAKKPIEVGERKPNSDRKRHPVHQRQFSPFKKLVIGERKPERQIIQPEAAANYEGKGKTPILEPKIDKFSDESGDEYKSFGGDDSDSERTPDQPQGQNGFIPYKKRIDHKDIEDKEKKELLSSELLITPEKYKCSTCNKGFSTHQALGGHRSSHNKLRVSIQNIAAVDHNSSNSPPQNYQTKNCISQILEEANKLEVTCNNNNNQSPHQCQICTKIFSSGQALGGHMRCHASSSTAATTQQVVDQSPKEEEEGNGGDRSARKVLKFDLNELPADMEDGAD